MKYTKVIAITLLSLMVSLSAFANDVGTGTVGGSISRFDINCDDLPDQDFSATCRNRQQLDLFRQQYSDGMITDPPTDPAGGGDIGG